MTIDQVKKLCQQVGLFPQRAAGQHFLLNESVIEKMVAAANIGLNDTILEIGPGFGVLTEKLLASGAKVIAVELDRRMAGYLSKKFKKIPNLTLLTGDVFRIKLPQYLTDRQYKLVANLPYSATSKVFRQFLTLPPRPSSIHVLIQKEVADRIVSEPGQMSLLSLSVQYYGQPKKLFEVAASMFYPMPEVTSAVLAVEHCRDGDQGISLTMFRLARIAFSGKRKQMHNSLANGLHWNSEKTEEILIKAGIAPEARPQELRVEDWLTLANLVGKEKAD